MFVCFFFFILCDPKTLQDIISTLDKQDTAHFLLEINHLVYFILHICERYLDILKYNMICYVYMICSKS